MGLRAPLEVAREAGISPAELLALLVLLAGALVLSGVVWWSGGAPGMTADPVGGPSEGSEATTAAAATPLVRVTAADVPPLLVVDVAGLVARPGVVELPAGSRVVDALRAAGGTIAGADTTTLNLARPLVDGEQVVVGDGSVPTADQPTSVVPSATTPDGRLDLNRAALDDLLGLPGVGPVTAQRILDHRAAIGGFVDVVQLLEVAGIGPARFASLEPLVAV